MTITDKVKENLAYSKELLNSGIDGANEAEKFWYITIPQLKPIMISIALLDFIWTMQVFPLM